MPFCMARKERMAIALKKYFAVRAASASAVRLSSVQIDSYRTQVVAEMKKLGATNRELLLLHDATIKNSIINKREPRDVAWAILQ